MYMMKMDKNKHLENIYIFIFIILIFIIISINKNLIKWIILEMFSLIMISYLNINNTNKKNSLMYYVISSILSLILLFIIIHNNFIMNNKMSTIISLLIQMIFYMKLGLFPFHQWMIYMYNSMSWMNIFIFSTLNKFINIYLMISLTNMNEFFMIMFLLNSLFSSLMSMNEFSIKKIICYSSMNHSSYMIILGYIDMSMLLIYFIIYLFNCYMFMTFYKIHMIENKIDLLMKSNNNSFKIPFLIISITYSMIPLTTMFYLKWLLFKMIILNNNIMIYIFILSISMIMMMWTYMNIMNYQFMKNKYELKMNILDKNYYNKNYFFMYISLLFNIFMFLLIY
uniref:NADH-ubiquinone oxidoreductase chain 2 n=1 Tax=Megachile sculpturalis TaxID=1004196 RepID=A0A0M3SUC1_9HYME|nr:NADH dehydrogenase subunit 2 [Megachile sculpturalis]